MAYGQILGQTPFPVAQNVEYNGKVSGVDNVKSALDKLNDEVVKAAESGGGNIPGETIIGTTNGGWTEKDCDYLCNDGDNDNTIFKEAISFATRKPAKAIRLLSGKYYPGTIEITSHVTIVGTGTGNQSCEINGGRFYQKSGRLVLKNVFLSGSRQQQFDTFGGECIIDGCLITIMSPGGLDIAVMNDFNDFTLKNSIVLQSKIACFSNRCTIVNNIFRNDFTRSNDSVLDVSLSKNSFVVGNIFENMRNTNNHTSDKIFFVYFGGKNSIISNNMFDSVDSNYVNGLRIVNNSNVVIGNRFNYNKKDSQVIAVELESFTEGNLVMCNNALYEIFNDKAPEGDNIVYSNLNKNNFS